MRYLWKYFPLPIPSKWWTLMLMGFTWIGEASFETQLAGLYLPRYYWEIVGPINISLFASTVFATVIGAVHLGLGLARTITVWRYQGLYGLRHDTGGPFK